MVTEQLAALGLALPAAPTPIGAYVPSVRTGNLVYTSGQLPLVGGVLPTRFIGKLGFNISLSEGQAAAKTAALNVLAVLDAAVGLENVVRIVRLSGHVACTPDFTDQPKVLNGASELLMSVLGAAGTHTRTALGAVALPRGACVEIEVVAEVKTA
jgi:enamine deaminase RidA (YjgF/YER057c/UK114 family)